MKRNLYIYWFFLILCKNYIFLLAQYAICSNQGVNNQITISLNSKAFRIQKDYEKVIVDVFCKYSHHKPIYKIIHAFLNEREFSFYQFEINMRFFGGLNNFVRKSSQSDEDILVIVIFIGHYMCFVAMTRQQRQKIKDFDANTVKGYYTLKNTIEIFRFKMASLLEILQKNNILTLISAQSQS
ncbi:hypothetical protein ABPG74_004589 [Tetrahymena malaccensis]